MYIFVCPLRTSYSYYGEHNERRRYMIQDYYFYYTRQTNSETAEDQLARYIEQKCIRKKRVHSVSQGIF